MPISLGKLEPVGVRAIWDSEARDFTPWLSENLNLLGDALGLDLELIETEAAVGNYACDIHARESGSGRFVVIENQLEQTDHGHLGQLLTYAAGLKAGVVVWISPYIRDEHREAVDFLNHNTLETIDFFAVALEVVRIGDSAPAVVFRLAASPNSWAKTASSGARQGPSNRMVAYQAFFQTLIDELREKYRFTKSKSAQPSSWYAFSSGYSGIVYSSAFSNKNSLRVELYIDSGYGDRNKAIFDYLHGRANEIQLAIGAPLFWERLDNKRACRISVVRENSSIELAAEHGDEYRAWSVSNLLKFKDVFGPALKEATQHVAQPRAAISSDNEPPLTTDATQLD